MSNQSINQLIQGIVNAQNMILSPQMDGPNVDHVNQTLAKAGEMLKQMNKHPQFCQACLQIVMNDQAQWYMKQAVLIMMKNYIIRFWSRELNVIHPSIKSNVRNNILKLLGSRHSKVVLATCSVVSNIAHHDFPDEWPTLLQILVNTFNNSVKSPNTIPLACGYAKCMGFVSEHFSDKNTEKFMPLIKMLLPVAGNKNFPDNLRAYCVKVVVNVLETLCLLSEINVDNARGMFNSYKPGLLSFVCAFTNEVKLERVRFGCRFKIEMYKLCQCLIVDFSEFLTNPEKGKLIQVQYQSLKNEFQVYYKTHIITDKPDESYDEESHATCTKTMIMQAFECLKTTIGNYNFFDVFQPGHITALSEVIFGYFQLDQNLLRLWKDSPNEFIDLTDDTTLGWNIRKHAQLILQEIVNMWEEKGLKLIVNVFKQWFARSFQMFQQDKSSRWMFIREAALYGIQSVMYEIETQNMAKMMELNIHEILASLLQIDLNRNSPSFLQAQGILFVGTTLSHQSSQQAIKLFQEIFPRLQNRSTPFPLRIAAARTLTKYISERKRLNFPPQAINSILPQILAGLCNLVQDSETSTLYISLECIKTAAQTNPMVIGDDLGKKICDFLFQQFQTHHTEIYDTYEILSTFNAFSKNRKLMVYMLQSIFPKLVNIVQTYKRQNVDYLSKMLEMLTQLLGGKTVSVTDSQEMVKRSFVPVMEVSSYCLQHQVDYELLQNCTIYFKMIIEGCPQFVFNTRITWTSFNNSTLLQIILGGFINRMLGIKDENDGCCLELGRLISAIIQHYDQFLLKNNVLQNLLKSLVLRLNFTDNTPLMQAICMVFVQMFAKGDVSYTLNILQFLNSIVITKWKYGNPQNPNASGLALLFSIWSHYNNFFQGYLERRFYCIALDHLLSNLNRFGSLLNQLKVPQQLASILVEKDLKKNPESYKEYIVNPKTGHRYQNHNYEMRRKGLQGVRLIPFPPRAFVLLVETLEYEIMISKKKEEKENVIIQFLKKNLPQDIGKKSINMYTDDDHMVINALMASDGSDEDDTFYDKFEMAKPVFKMNLVDFLAKNIKKLAQMNNNYVNVAMSCVTDRTKKMLRNLLSYNGPMMGQGGGGPPQNNQGGRNFQNNQGGGGGGGGNFQNNQGGGGGGGGNFQNNQGGGGGGNFQNNQGMGNFMGQGGGGGF